MPALRRLFLTLVLASLPSALRAQVVAADIGPSTGCTFQNQVYTCNKPWFLKELAASKTIATAAAATDRTGRAQLQQLIARLGKQERAKGTRADLTFLLAPIATEGVSVGPSGTDLATLRIYRTRPDGDRGNLLWAETLAGQPDTPWPLVVRALLSQFQADLAKP